MIKRFGIVAILAVGAVVMTGCSGDEIVRFGWPVGVTPQAESMRHLWTWSVIAALLMGILVWGLIFWTI
ncbi:cytochrome C oxidase subunit II, partial [Gordonia sp. i37]